MTEIRAGTKTVLTIDWKDADAGTVERLSRSWAKKISAGADDREVRMQIDVDLVTIPRRTYRTMRALMKAMTDRLGGFVVDGAEMWEADKQTLEQSFHGDDADWEKATWRLELRDEPPPDEPTVVVENPDEPEPEPQPEPSPEPVKDPDAVSLGRRGGKKGGPARARSQTKEQLSAAGKKGAEARWRKKREQEAERHPFNPDWRVAPGETLKDIMAERGITEEGLAWMTGLALTIGMIREILDGTATLTRDIAEELEAALVKPSAQFWLNLEEQYRRPVTP